jgi:predicted AAA+ superfamily ATPase
VKKQLLQAPKFYLFDCGVLNALHGFLRADIKPSSFVYGKLFENLIVQELMRANDYLDLGLRFNYWRDKNGAEVDLVVSQNLGKPLVAIEIKSGAEPDALDCGGFRAFADDYPKVPRYCLCTTPRPLDRDGMRFLPWQDGVRELANIAAG